MLDVYSYIYETNGIDPLSTNLNPKKLYFNRRNNENFNRDDNEIFDYKIQHID